MRYLQYFVFFIFILFSCNKDNDNDTLIGLSSYLNNRIYEEGAVIACAASDNLTNDIVTFYYPENGASNIRFYETETLEINELDYSNYTQTFIESAPFFNGYLGMFTQKSANEKWVIITFELDNEIKISNPIRTKQITKPTVWTNSVTINQTESARPSFVWEDNVVADNAIYFQVISDLQNNLLSGTYTFENNFQYYNTSNVVLNITTETPPQLIVNNNYNFTLMDVSADNWVNLVILNTFKVE